jgi:hypothetical protein
MYTNEHSKVFEVSDFPSKNIYITERQRLAQKKAENGGEYVEEMPKVLEELKYDDSLIITTQAAGD